MSQPADPLSIDPRDPRYTGPCGALAAVNGLAYKCALPKFHPGTHQAFGVPVAEWLQDDYPPLIVTPVLKTSP